MRIPRERPQPLSLFFAEFCESQTHLDSLLSKINSNQKSKIASKMGIFLRRPWTVAKHYGIELAPTSEDFWSQSFVDLKKSKPLHHLLAELWRTGHGIPRDGTLDDFPTEMRENWITDWGQERAEQMAKLLTQDPMTTIRLNRKAQAADVTAQVVAEAKPRAGFYSPQALLFKGYASVQKTDAFKSGGLEIQDEGSQLMSAFVLADEAVAKALSATPSVGRPSFDVGHLAVALKEARPLIVVDACAGSGGKTLAISDFMRGQGRVYAYDIYLRKILALKKRMERAETTNIQAVALDRNAEAGNNEAINKFQGRADRLLIDSPCSGWGVLRRNPDIKWSRKPRPLASVSHPDRSITELQRQVVTEYLPLLKLGGIFTYGVCTFQKAETLDQVEWILQTFPKLMLRHSGFVGPHETDCFFMASFVLTGH